MRSQRRHGMTRVDVLVLTACTGVAIALGTMAFAQDEKPKPVLNVKTIKDATQLVQIHQAMVIFASDNKGLLPHPGLINRLAIGDDAEPALAGKHVPGMGDEDLSQNTTANLYSVLICMQYISPEIVLSPVERNPNVKLVQAYDFDAYNPAEDSYWDPKFNADLVKGSNTSYAHQPITNERKHLWNNQMMPNVAQLGNRGPRDGAIGYDSITCGPHGNWAGNVTFGDNHTEFFDTTTPAWIEGDNLFKADDRKHDALLAFTKMIKDGKAVLEFD